jgi:glycosyltransferase involved in cell wall biosynthesis
MSTVHRQRPPLVSVLINTYNYGRFIDDAIRSVVEQDFPAEDVEIIVVDDGSTDDTPQRMTKWGSRILYIRKENGGQASAYNVGFESSRGEIICFLDADDYWHRDKLNTIMHIFRSSESTQVLFHTLEVVDDKGVTIGYTPKGLLHKSEMGVPTKDYLRNISRYASPSSGICVRASCLRRIMPVPEQLRVAADSYLHFFLPLSAQTITILPQPLGKYRVHGASHWITTVDANALTLKNIERLLAMRRALIPSLDREQFQNMPLLSDLRFAVESEVATLEIMELSLRGERGTALRKARTVPVRGSMGERFIARSALLLLALLPLAVFGLLKRLFRSLVPSDE